MGPRSIAVALALAGPLTLSPALAWADTAEPAAQTGATEVTVDLSGLAGEPAGPGGPLAQTADAQGAGTLALGAAGMLAGGTGCLLLRATSRGAGRRAKDKDGSW